MMKNGNTTGDWRKHFQVRIMKAMLFLFLIRTLPAHTRRKRQTGARNIDPVATITLFLARARKLVLLNTSSKFCRSVERSISEAGRMRRCLFDGRGEHPVDRQEIEAENHQNRDA